MKEVVRRKRGVIAPADVRRRVSGMLSGMSPTEAAEALGVRRDVLLAVAAGARVLVGSVALIEQRLAERGPK